MRRKDKEITNQEEILDILQTGELITIAMQDETEPYQVIMNYGFDGKYIYLHGAKEGRKMEIIEKNPRICFSIYLDYKLAGKKGTAEVTARYRSVIGYGKTKVIEDFEEKKEAVDILLKQADAGTVAEIPDIAIKSVAILKIEIETMTGKKSGF